ncbi:MAG: VOC family protein [Pseudomonadales bacterium]|nr:VOC family protein [Pseudomonadales bacterium]
MHQHETINYLEFPAKDIAKTKAFFESTFGWTFTDFGPDYTAFENAGLMGGFYRSDNTMSTDTGSALIVLYSNDLEATQTKIEQLGGRTVKAVFSFPGGRRFHFADPNNNEYAVWSDK